jgi:large subunit ribosomal protein L24
MKLKIRKGDTVQLLSGKDRGKRGQVIEVQRDQDRVVVEGLNIRKKNVRPRRQGEKGQIVEFPGAVNSSNVALVCSSCKKVTRIGMRVLNDGKRERMCKKCDSAITIADKK